MAQPNVLIFIVPGTWHPASAYEPFASKLRRAGYAAEIASLPTFNPKVVDTDCATDTEALRRLLSNLVQAEGRDVVVFAHSYGGMPAGGAAYGLGKSSRARRSEKGGVIGLVYMSAFIIAEGISLSESMGGHSPSYISPDNVHTYSYRALNHIIFHALLTGLAFKGIVYSHGRQRYLLCRRRLANCRSNGATAWPARQPCLRLSSSGSGVG